jgi:hypothetical protein
MGSPDVVSGVNARTVVVVAAAVVLVAAQAGLVAFVLGFGPFDPGTAGPEPAAPQSSGGDGSGSAGTGGSGAGGGGSGSGSSAGSGDGSAEAGEPPPYDLDVLGTERCGNTCRDVTVRLTNNRNATAEDVTVRTSIYAGNTTGENARVWSGRNEVGTLDAGGSTTATARVSLSYFEAIDVKRKGGWVTIVTTVESAETTRSFRERRQVA